MARPLDDRLEQDGVDEDLRRLLLHLVGHRRTFIVCVLGLLGAWICIIFSNTVWMFMLNRAASGVWLGIMTNCACLYVTDVAPPEKRALYGSLTEAATSAGALIAYTVSGLSWSMQASTCAILCVAALSLQYYVVESPHWYLAYGCRKDVNVATARMYGVVPQPEYRSKEAEEASQLVHPTRTHKEARMMCVCLLLHLAHNMSCTPLFTMRAIQVMATLLGAGYSGVGAFLLLAALVIVTASFSALTSLVGRRRLLCASALLVAGTLFALRPLDHLVLIQWSPEKLDGPVNWQAVLSVCALVLGYSVGLCHVPTLLTGELIPMRLRFFGSSFVWASRWLIAFLMVHFDAEVVAAFGRKDTFIVYGLGVGLFVGAAVLLIPDTESRPLHDIDLAS
ncbi:facilitated trehalose transporter Tret1-like [Haemaphysalis longicornis]